MTIKQSLFLISIICGSQALAREVILKDLAGIAAEPAAGIVETCGDLLVGTAWDEFKKTHDLKKAFEAAKNTPLFHGGQAAADQAEAAFDIMKNTTKLVPAFGASKKTPGDKIVDLIQRKRLGKGSSVKSVYIAVSVTLVGCVAYQVGKGLLRSHAERKALNQQQQQSPVPATPVHQKVVLQKSSLMQWSNPHDMLGPVL